MSSKGTEEDFLYKSLPALWEVSSTDYGNRIKKNEQYAELLCKYKDFMTQKTKNIFSLFGSITIVSYAQ